MKIRNKKYYELNLTERKLVDNHYKTCKESKSCTDRKCNSVETFWERHREIDTDNGKYNGWLNTLSEKDKYLIKLQTIFQKYTGCKLNPFSSGCCGSCFKALSNKIDWRWMTYNIYFTLIEDKKEVYKTSIKYIRNEFKEVYGR